MESEIISRELPQQDFLLRAIELSGMTRDEFALRFSVTRERLERWLLPCMSAEFRTLPDNGRRFIVEVLNRVRADRWQPGDRSLRGARCERKAQSEDWTAAILAVQLILHN